MENDNARQRRFMNEGMTQQEFIAWAAERKIDIVLQKDKFKAGDKVVYTNEFGVSFENKEILGFEAKGGLVYLNKDSYWYPIPLKSLSFEVPEKKTELRTVKGITFEMVGYDDWYRKLFKAPNGRICAEVDGKLHTISSDYGEPIASIE